MTVVSLAGLPLLPPVAASRMVLHELVVAVAAAYAASHARSVSGLRRTTPCSANSRLTTAPR